MNSKAVSDKYPDQSDARTLAFNQDLGANLAKDFPEVVFLNLWELSREFVLGNRTSDGFHSLSDSNLIKTMMLFNAMKLMLQQQP